MKKFLVILMVVAMASFLFVGCLGDGVAPPVDDVDDVVDVAKTDTPYITSIGSISLYSTDTQYTITATTGGVGVAGAVIKLYIDGVQAGVDNSGTAGSFSVTVSMIKLTEGVKKLYVTATVPGLAESDKSTEYTFTVDKTAPKIASAVADSSDNFITVTFNEDVKTTKEFAGTGTTAEKLAAWLLSAINPDNWTITYTSSGDHSFVATSSKVIRITPTGGVDLPAVGGVFTLSCNGIADSLGNTMDAASTYVGAISD